MEKKNVYPKKYVELRTFDGTQLFNEIPTSTNNSLNPRPELLEGTDDDHPVQVSHYLQDLGPKGGKGAMSLFIDLSLKIAPHGRI